MTQGAQSEETDPSQPHSRRGHSSSSESPVRGPTAKRKRHFDRYENPPKRQRAAKPAQAEHRRVPGEETQNPVANDQTTSESWDEYLQEADARSTWEYFFLFNGGFADDLTADILPGTSARDKAFQAVRYKILENVRHFQHRSLNAAIEHVEEVRTIDSGESGSRVLEGIESTSSTGLAKWYHKTFSKEKFFTVFYFMNSILDYDKSSRLGKWYCRELYAILCTRVHLHINWKRDEYRHYYRNSRNEVMDFMKGMIVKCEAFANIEKRHFKELPGKLAKQKKVPRVPILVPTFGDRFHITSQPPLFDEEDTEGV